MLFSPDEVPRDYAKKIAVLQAVDAPLRRITVNEICSKANISRKTFYSLFETKESIMSWFQGVCMDLSIMKIGTTLSWREGLTLYLELLEEQRRFFEIHYVEWSDKSVSMSLSLFRKRQSDIRSLLEARGVPIDPVLVMEMQAFALTMPEFMRIWFSPNDFESMESFVDTWIDCIPRRLYEVSEKVSE